jgi:hypothetical protein
MELSVLALVSDRVMLAARSIGESRMNKRDMSIVVTIGILCLGGFALASAQAMPEISAIHQITAGKDPLVQVRKKSAKRKQPTSGRRGGWTGSGASGVGAAGGATGSGSGLGMGAGGGGGY